MHFGYLFEKRWKMKFFINWPFIDKKWLNSGRNVFVRTLNPWLMDFMGNVTNYDVSTT